MFVLTHGYLQQRSLLFQTFPCLSLTLARVFALDDKV
jgi:hypothetical protein